MKIFKPKFWDQRPGILAYLLFPLSIFFGIVIFIRKKIIKKIKFNIPIICVGNIYLGGTGKTPSSILISNELFKSGKRPALIRKFYKEHLDEYQLIRSYNKNLFLDELRQNAINKSINEGYDIAILDDGFQDYKINKDLNILCFNQKQLLGNGFILPSGPLRENLFALKDVHIVLINGERDKIFENKILSFNKYISIFYTKYVPTNLRNFMGKKLTALAGIGNPKNFFDILDENNLNVSKKLIFPDHYNFSKSEILKIIDKARSEGSKIIMTEKDYFRIKKFNLSEVNYLKIDLKIKEKDQFLKKIMDLYD